MSQKVGEISFILGVVLAVLIGLVGNYLGDFQQILISLLIVFGLIVGFLNIEKKQKKDFVMMAVALILVAFAGGGSLALEEVIGIGPFLAGIFNAIMAFVVPATIVVILKEIYALAKVK